jgi:hypothetical protein
LTQKSREKYSQHDSKMKRFKHRIADLSAMRIMKRIFLRREFFALLVCTGLGGNSPAQSTAPAAQWSFVRSQGAAPADSVRGIQGKLDGFYSYVAGVSGDALRFDGYTTSMTVPLHDAPAVGKNGFTIAAWVALNTYPWNRVPVVDQEKSATSGVFSRHRRVWPRRFGGRNQRAVADSHFQVNASAEEMGSHRRNP